MRKTLLPILSLSIWLAGSPAIRAQEPEGWIATYDGGPGGGLDRPVGIAVDAAGAVYVAGNTGRGTTTVKYDVEGKLLWSTVAEGDHARAMALDSGGNLLVAKRVSNVDRIVVYDAAGTESVRARVVGEVVSMELDANDHLFVLSRIDRTGFRLTRYDPQFDREWSDTVIVPAGGGTVVVLSADDDGGAHVIATSRSCTQNGCWRVYRLVKYDSAGDTVWETRGVPVHESFEPVGVALDQDGNLLVAGHVDRCDELLIAAGYAVIKYGPDGNVLWTACYEWPAQWSVQATAVASDSAGNVYVTGSGCGGVTCSYTTVKYGPDGALLWEAELSGGRPVAMSVDPTGAIIVTGYRGVLSGAGLREEVHDGEVRCWRQGAVGPAVRGHAGGGLDREGVGPGQRGRRARGRDCLEGLRRGQVRPGWRGGVARLLRHAPRAGGDTDRHRGRRRRPGVRRGELLRPRRLRLDSAPV